MSARRAVAAVAAALAASLGGAAATFAEPPPSSLGAHVSACAVEALGARAEPPAVTCEHDGHVHTFAKFGELVAHLREHHG